MLIDLPPFSLNIKKMHEVDASQGVDSITSLAKMTINH